MSQHIARLTHDLDREVAKLRADCQNRRGGANDIYNRHQDTVAPDAMDHPHHSIPGVFHHSDVRGKKFWNPKRIEHVGHDVSPIARKPSWRAFARLQLNSAFQNITVNESFPAAATGENATVAIPIPVSVAVADGGVS